MLLASLPPDHLIRIRCKKCGESGSFTASELIKAFGPEVVLDELGDRFRKCCGQPLEVETGVH